MQLMTSTPISHPTPRMHSITHKLCMQMALLGLYKTLQFDNCEGAEIAFPFIFQTESIVNSKIKRVNHIRGISHDVTYVTRQTNAKNKKSQHCLLWLGHIFFSSPYFLLRYFPLVLADISNIYTQEVWSQGKTMSRRRGEDSCPFLDGVYVSVMRRFEHLSIWWLLSSLFFETYLLNISLLFSTRGSSIPASTSSSCPKWSWCSQQLSFLTGCTFLQILVDNGHK